MNRYNRHNIHYKDAHSLCRLLKENSGLSDFYHGNVSYAVPFFLDMNKIFEGFVTKLLENYMDEKVLAQRSENAWRIDGGKPIKMIPDILLFDKGTRKINAIIDVKYKDHLENSDLYQIGFYINEYGKTSFESDEAFAILPQDTSMHNSIEYTADTSKIKIHARFLSIEEFINLINHGDFEIIKSKLKSIVNYEKNF